MKIKKLAQKIKSKLIHRIHDEFEDVNLGMGSTHQEDIQRLHNKKIKNTKTKK